MATEANRSTLPITVAIPTYNRGAIVLETVKMLQELNPAPNEILIIDQSEDHADGISETLSQLHDEKSIRWIRREQPSITKAMNHALREATNDVILFLDDDIKPKPGLIQNHYRNYSDESIHAVVGQVLQPNETPQDIAYEEKETGLNEGLCFPFYSTQKNDVKNVMAGNLSVRIRTAQEVGGFDENFMFVAYRFETDFARRLIAGGFRIVYEPEAGIHHLRIRSGGTRNRANHLTSPRPDHSVGDYYYALKHGQGWERLSYSSRRFLKSFLTRFHLKHPWYIPFVMTGELRGFMMAWSLSHKTTRKRSNEKHVVESESPPVDRDLERERGQSDAKESVSVGEAH